MRIFLTSWACKSLISISLLALFLGVAAPAWTEEDKKIPCRTTRQELSDGTILYECHNNEQTSWVVTDGSKKESRHLIKALELSLIETRKQYTTWDTEENSNGIAVIHIHNISPNDVGIEGWATIDNAVYQFLDALRIDPDADITVLSELIILAGYGNRYFQDIEPLLPTLDSYKMLYAYTAYIDPSFAERKDIPSEEDTLATIKKIAEVVKYGNVPRFSIPVDDTTVKKIESASPELWETIKDKFMYGNLQ